MFKVMELGLGVSLWDLTDLADSQQKKKNRAGWGDFSPITIWVEFWKLMNLEDLGRHYEVTAPANILTSAW